MSFKSILACAVLAVSVNAMAIPPAPPTAIYNKIKTIAAKNCRTVDGDIYVSDLKNDETVQFVLQLNKDGSRGILTVIQDGQVSENLEVTCR